MFIYQKMNYITIYTVHLISKFALMDQNELQNMRQDYSAAELSEDATKGDPIKQFEKWFNEAVESKQHEPNAMTLATATLRRPPIGAYCFVKRV